MTETIHSIPTDPEERWEHLLKLLPKCGECGLLAGKVLQKYPQDVPAYRCDAHVAAETLVEFADWKAVPWVDHVDTLFAKKREEALKMPTCQVCEKNESVTICSSAIGPVSFAYCLPCGRVGAEPYSALVGCLAGCGGIEGVNEECLHIIDVSLPIVGKTMEQLKVDVDKAIKEYDVAMQEPPVG